MAAKLCAPLKNLDALDTFYSGVIHDFWSMKYSMSVDLDTPRDEVLQRFQDPESAQHWMRGLQYMKALDGSPGEVGSTSEMEFINGKRKIKMVETIKEKSLPDFMTFTYDAPGVHNIVKVKFEALEGGRTRYTTDQEFQFSSLAMKFFAWLMPGMFKKQSSMILNDFKQYVDEGISVKES